jgi:hypothetical protein
LDFGKTEIFLQMGLDRAKAQAVADLPVGHKSVEFSIIDEYNPG